MNRLPPNGSRASGAALKKDPFLHLRAPAAFKRRNLPQGRPQLLTVTVTPAEVVVFPDASRAVAVSVYVPFPMPCESHESEYFVLGDSVVTSAPMLWPLNLNWTPATARSSTAVAVSVTVPVSVV